MFEDEPEGGTGVSLSLAELLALKGEPQLVFANDSARGASKAIARGRKAVRRYMTWPLCRMSYVSTVCVSTVCFFLLPRWPNKVDRP